MKKYYSALILIFLFQTSFGQKKVFEGAWFTIKYPSNFTAVGSLRSTSADGYESAFFKSPDGLVEFYIFSPQWGGNYDDISVKPNEKILSKNISKYSDNTITYWTISDKNATYLRSYQETSLDETTNWVIGIKYKNQSAFNKYKQAYLDFKKSLVKFEDH
jgi:hypothetical protein